MVPKAVVGSQTNIANRREIMLADLPVKALTARLRRRIVPVAQDAIIGSQPGAGLLAGPCPLAHL